MNFRPRHLLIRWVLPLAWKVSAKQRARLLQEFSRTELDSAWQSLYALERVSDPALSALLFQHALEELEHADLFRKLSEEKSPMPPVIPLTRREPLLQLEAQPGRRALEFFAFLAIGESEIRHDFGVYERALPCRDARALFRAIREDEEHHAEDSSAELAKLANKDGISLFSIRVRHHFALGGRRYASLMSKFGQLPMTALLFLAYILFGGIFFRQARQRLALSRERQLELLRRQEAGFQESLSASP